MGQFFAGAFSGSLVNRRTGTYLHLTLFRVLEFNTRTEAICYIKRLGLNRDIYVTEAVL